MDLIPELEDVLEKGIVIHFNILAQKIPQIEEPGGLQSRGLQESYTTEHEHYALYYHRGQIFSAAFNLDKAMCGYYKAKIG